jgi:hypothetical protein
MMSSTETSNNLTTRKGYPERIDVDRNFTPKETNKLTKDNKNN